MMMIKNTSFSQYPLKPGNITFIALSYILQKPHLQLYLILITMQERSTIYSTLPPYYFIT